MGTPRFFKRRLDLGKTFNRSSQDGSHHWAGSTFKSFAVIGAGNDNGDPNPQFSLTLVPEPDGSTQGVPLYDGFFQNFGRPVKDAVIENSLIQPGVWVEILFSTEDILDLGTKTKKNDLKYGNLLVGHSQAPDDGLTFIANISRDYNIGGAFLDQHLVGTASGSCQFRNLTGLENPSNYMNGLLAASPAFKVPTGYRLYVLAAEYDVITAFVGGLVIPTLLSGTDGAGVAPAWDANNQVSTVGIPLTTPVTLNVKASLQSGATNNYSSYFEEGSIPCISWRKIGTPTAGLFGFRLLFRLKKKA